MSENFESDEIFLLSKEEYNKYKSAIPHINCYWWLRSPGYCQSYAASVNNVGSVYYHGYSVIIDIDCVRPALRYSNLKSQISKSKKGNDYFMFGEVRWKIIDYDLELAIAEFPINFGRFDSKSNNYETSEIREWLLDWLKQAK